MSEYTRGPWGARPGSHGSQWVVSATRTGQVIGEVYAGTGQPVEANALLISAAPELLAACEAVLGWLRAPPEMRDLAGGPGGENAARLLEGAIAKARGG